MGREILRPHGGVVLGQVHLLGQDHLPPSKVHPGQWLPTTPGPQLVQFGCRDPQGSGECQSDLLRHSEGMGPPFLPLFPSPLPGSTLSPVKQTLGLGTPKGQSKSSFFFFFLSNTKETNKYSLHQRP